MRVKFPCWRFALVVAVTLLTWGILCLQGTDQETPATATQSEVRAWPVEDYFGAGVGIGAAERWWASKMRGEKQGLQPLRWHARGGPETPLFAAFLSVPMGGMSKTTGPQLAGVWEGAGNSWFPGGGPKKPNAPPLG